jgi:hypothetical protein
MLNRSFTGNIPSLADCGDDGFNRTITFAEETTI